MALSLGSSANTSKSPATGDGEFEHVLVDVEPAEVVDDGSVSAFADPAGAGFVASAEVDGGVEVVEAFDDFVEQVDGEVEFGARVVVLGADFFVDEETDVGVVELDESDAGVAAGFEFFSQVGDEGAHEFFAGGVGVFALFGVPHSGAEEVGGRGGRPWPGSWSWIGRSGLPWRRGRCAWVRVCRRRRSRVGRLCRRRRSRRGCRR